MQVVYIDILFILNLIMDYIIFTIVGMLMQRRVSKIKRIGASILAALLYCVTLYIPVLQGFLAVFYALFIPVVPVLWLFKPKGIRHFIKILLSSWVVAFVVGGAIFNFYYGYGMRKISFQFVCLVAIGIGFMSFLGFRLIRKQFIEPRFLYELEMHHKGKSCHLLSLLDTGNCLYTLIKHEPVIVITYDKIKPLLPLLWEECISECLEKGTLTTLGQKKYSILPIKLIPFTSVGAKDGLLIGIVIDQMKVIKGEKVYIFKNCVLGIGEEKLFSNESYDALLHPDFITYS
jgi:stage II sporulation protein GA (sporulation sigma-E factor processing peptidase)